MTPLDIYAVPSPCFVLDMGALRKNLSILDTVRKRTGARILLAQKAFSMWSVYPLISQILDGTCASSPFEARLGRENFGKEVHSFAAAYSEQDLLELLSLSDYIVFNSFSQWHRFRDICKKFEGKVSFGLRVNPEHSEADAEIYSPCAPNSRLGIKKEAFIGESLEGISGLHFHTLCQKNSDALERTLDAFEARFAKYIPQMEWVNFGGGHHITRADYDIDLLCKLITDFQKRYGIKTIYLEPGEAVALNAGVLVSTVLDITRNITDIAIIDASAPAHTPDVIEMPYRPEIEGAGQPGEYPNLYRIGGHSCLAGDIFGDYSFPQPLKPGDRIAFEDMMIYSMVKTNTFNGLALPSIGIWEPETAKFTIIKEFSYRDFKERLS